MRSAFILLAGAGAVSAWSELLHTLIMNKNVDAIVKPGAYNSHMHSFFGSDAITNVMPTTEDLQKGCYSGVNPNDLSVYWVPTLYHVDGDVFTEVPVFTFGTYYTAAYSEIPIPPNFAAISGLASAKTQAEADQESANELGWYCEESPGVYETEKGKMPKKACQQHLRFTLLFPNCVNPDNITNYGFSDATTNSCPDGMKRMAQLRYSARYDVRSVAPNGWEGTAPFQLSCSDTPGDGYCMHGDFINGWYEDAALDMLIGEGSGRDDGKFISGALGSSATPATCVPTDQDPENGTSDYWESIAMLNSDAVAAKPVSSASESASTVVADVIVSTGSGLVAESTLTFSTVTVTVTTEPTVAAGLGPIESTILAESIITVPALIVPTLETGTSAVSTLCNATASQPTPTRTPGYRWRNSAKFRPVA